LLAIDFTVTIKPLAHVEVFLLCQNKSSVGNAKQKPLLAQNGGVVLGFYQCGIE